MYEEDDEIIEETPSEQPEEKIRLKKRLFSRKSAAPVREVPAAPAEPEPERKSFFQKQNNCYARVKNHFHTNGAKAG